MTSQKTKQKKNVKTLLAANHSSKTTSKDLRVVSEPLIFFQQKVTKALQNQRVNVDPHTEFYLVDLLRRFMLAENLYTIDESGNLREEVLALLMSQANSTSNHFQKQQGLRRLGDVSLYTAGFFSDSLSRKVVDVDYYVGMGQSAYGSLARMGMDVLFQKAYHELSSNFIKFVDVLAEISDSTCLKDTKNLLRLYELWLKTKSERAEKSLKEAGIIPNNQLKSNLQ